MQGARRLDPRRLVLWGFLLLALGACSDRFGADTPLAPPSGSFPLSNAGDTELGAQAFDGTLRVGVVPAAQRVILGAAGAYVVRDRASGETLLTGPGGDVEVVLQSTAVIVTRWRLQVAYTASQEAVDSWVADATAQGYETYVEPHPTLAGWRLLIGSFPLSAPWGERNAFRDEVIAKGLAGTDSFWREITTTQGEQRIRLSGGGESVEASGPLVLEAADGRVRIAGELYRGVAEVVFNSVGSLAGVNRVAIEEYLYGVVPRELPPTVWGQMEAQKAQAVAARTYALANLGKHRANGYDLLATTADQVYGGVAAEHPISTQAVDATAGVVATHGGVPIAAVYHSTSGGFTGNNEDIWTSAGVPYLRGVRDGEPGPAGSGETPTEEELVRMLRPNPAGETDRATGDFYGSSSRYHRWTVQWTPAQISEVVSAFAGRPVGAVLEINVVRRSASGRVAELEFVTEAGRFVEFKDRIRWALRYVDAGGAQQVLFSTLFIVEPVLERNRGGVGRGEQAWRIAGWTAHGGGWGHGIGMSQTGAAGMADRGYTFEQILTRYYQGIRLETRW